ncbi:MAG: glycosyl transferase [Chloroflexi bacterium]|nr:glycosyl transferase [Chloroflexota bacterium]
MGTTRIAILILAHKNQEQLIKLVDHLKTDFSIYVHIDRKSKIRINSENNVHSIKKFKVYWGSYNQILATRELMKIAATGNHDRYLLISGQDLPIVSNKEIIQYFISNKNNYLRGCKLPAVSSGRREDLWRMLYFYFTLGDRGKYLNKYFLFFEYKLRKFQDYFKLYRRIPDNMYWGCNWFNLTHEAVMICLEKMYDNKYINLFKYTKCADEVVIQSILYNSKLLSSIENEDLRYTDWSMGGSNPKVLTLEDYNKIVNSAKLFARKFDDTIDSAIIDKIYEMIA